MRRFCILILALGLPASALAPASGTTRANFSAYAPGEVIVKLKELQPVTAGGEEPLIALRRAIGQRLSEFQVRSLEPLAIANGNKRFDEIISSRGLDRTFVLKFDPAASVDSMVSLLSASEAVEHVEPNYRIVPGSELPDDPGFHDQWALRNLGIGVEGQPSTLEADIEAPAAWEITSGSPDIIIAVTDTGIDITHPDIAPNIYTNTREIAGNGIDDDHNGYIDDVHGFNVAERNSDISDVAGHGTEMAGIIAARTNNEIGISGVCQSKILVVKFFRSTGPNPDQFDATVGDGARALLYSIAAGASIINASWRTLLNPGQVPDDQAQALRDACEATNDAGALLVCIAGNDGYDNDYTRVYPGAYELPNQIVVAASDYNDELWHIQGDRTSFNSGWGKRTVQLCAPGVSVLTTTARGNCLGCSASSDANDWYARVDGTSASAAFVSGVAALVKTKYPDDYVTLIRRRILAGVRVLDQLQPYVVTGGRLSAVGALTAVVTVNPPVITKLKYKSGGEKLLIYGEAMQQGAVVLIGSKTYPTKPKSDDLSVIFARVPATALLAGSPVTIKLRNPDGGVSEPFAFTR